MTRQRNPEAPKIGEKVKQALAGLALKQWKTPYAAAKALGLSETTLRRHMRGGKSRAEAREAQQKLTKAEEKVLVEWITRLTATGHPARHGFIRDMAEEIRRQRDSGGIATRLIIPLGICWVQQFISRHPQLSRTGGDLVHLISTHLHKSHLTITMTRPKNSGSSEKEARIQAAIAAVRNKEKTASVAIRDFNIPVKRFMIDSTENFHVTLHTRKTSF
jgi:hypothetical protein